MLFIILIRIIIWLTFFLLIAEGIGAIFLVRWFYALYMREHIKLADRVTALEKAKIGEHG